MICVICERTEAEQGMVCGPDRQRLPRQLDELIRRYIELGSEGPLVDSAWTVTQHRPFLDRCGKPIRVNGETVTRTSVEAGGDVAQLLPFANTSKRIGPPLSGTGEAPLPVDLDDVDLTGPVRPASIGIRHRGGWAAKGGDPDQVGHLTIATELDWYVKEWIADRDKGEGLPIATVPVLARWLRERTDWACDHSLTIDDFAVKLKHLVGALRAAQGDLPPKPQLMDQPCPGCGYLTLIRRPGEDWIDCDRDECRRVYSMADYAGWLKPIAAKTEERGDTAAWEARMALQAAERERARAEAEYVAGGGIIYASASEVWAASPAACKTCNKVRATTRFARFEMVNTCRERERPCRHKHHAEDGPVMAAVEEMMAA